MTCADLEPMLAGYEANELSPAQQEFVALHLERCAQCQQALGNLRFTRGVLEEWPVVRPVPSMTATVMSRLGSQTARRGWLPTPGLSAAAAALLVLFGLVALPAWAPGHLPPTTFSALTDSGWLRVATTERTATVAVTTAQGDEQFAVGDELLVLTLDGELRRYTSDGALQTRYSGLQGRLLAASVDTAWIVREDIAGLFSIDRVDLTTGEVHRDPFGRQGIIADGALSAHDSLYLLVKVGTRPYLKIFDTTAHMLDVAIPLDSEFAEGASLLTDPLSDDGFVSMLIAGNDVMGRVIEGRVEKIPAPGLTYQAVLVGGQIISLTGPGQLTVFDAESGVSLQEYRAPSALTAISLSPDGAFIYSQAGRLLYVASVKTPGAWHRFGLR